MFCIGVSPRQSPDSCCAASTASSPLRRLSAMYAPPRKVRPTMVQVSALSFTPIFGRPKYRKKSCTSSGVFRASSM